MQKENNKKPTYLYALGGLEEIGKNTYVIEHDNQMIIVDAGIKFAPDDMLGINGMVANYQTLIENQEKIDALVITHGHEDHIGGIPYLLKHIPIKKIIAPAFATKLICKKLNEFKGISLPEFVEVTDEDYKFKIGKIEMEFIRVCHSIPDAYSIFFKTPNGSIFETGDFRFDLGLGEGQTNFAQLLDVRAQGLDVLLCESTNAEVPGFSESEAVIFNNLYNIIKEAPGRVFLSTFASNINRIQRVVEMALTFNRKICIIGKSMDTNIKISKKMKLVNLTDNDLIKPADIKKYQDNEILVLLTGSQGEEMAALNVMAKQKHPKVSLKPSDTVILSSNPIPGNFASVESMVDKLYKLGVTVIENNPNLKIHASGHATMQELQLLMHLLEPKWIFPIHGEYKMMRKMQKLAMATGLEKDHIIISTNGHKLALLEGQLSLTNIEVPGDPMYINGKDIKTDSSALLNERKILSNEGIIELAICYSSKEKRIINIEIATRGCFIAKDKMPLLKKLKAILIDSLTTEINLHPDDNTENLSNYAKSITKTTIWKSCHKNPLIFATFLDFDFIVTQIKEGNYLEKNTDKPNSNQTASSTNSDGSTIVTNAISSNSTKNPESNQDDENKNQDIDQDNDIDNDVDDDEYSDTDIDDEIIDDDIDDDEYDDFEVDDFDDDNDNEIDDIDIDDIDDDDNDMDEDIDDEDEYEKYMDDNIPDINKLNDESQIDLDDDFDISLIDFMIPKELVRPTPKERANNNNKKHFKKDFKKNNFKRNNNNNSNNNNNNNKKNFYKPTNNKTNKTNKTNKNS